MATFEPAIKLPSPPTNNLLYQPQREPSAAPPSRDPWRTELSREIEVEGGASPGRADFSDVEQGRESGRSLFILSLPPTLARPSLPHCALPWTNGLSSVCRCNLVQSCWSLVDRTSQHDQVRSRTLDGVSNAAPRSRDAPDSPRANVVSLSLRAHHHSGSSHKVALRPERPSKTQRCVRPRRSSAFRVPTYVVCCLVRVLELCDVATARRLNESLTRERRCNSSRRSIKSGNTKLLRRVG